MNDLNRCDPNNPILLPEFVETTENEPEYFAKNKPCWERICRLEAGGKRVWLKPLIRCVCGKWTGIGLHHVHADGLVTASFFDATSEQLQAMGELGKRFVGGGCGWHVYIKLLNYDLGEFLPEP